MAEGKVRVRFAPSPTGHLHVGGARTALYNWLFARHEGGTFILRIEDTDRTRSTEEMVRAIVESMKWLGLDWDEGPYRQSEALPIYAEYAKRLLDSGHAYYEEDKEKGRAIRFKIGEGITTFGDMIHGDISVNAADIEDFVILKSDGFPTYNFACVVDDARMTITHVIRGDDHISNTPKQLCLYKALGLEAPKFAHIPMILGEDGTRLSKRHGATSVEEYRRAGYLSEALVNFLALLGWSPGDDQEVLSRRELIEKFTIERCGKTSARFDHQKLDWMNGVYIKNMPAPQLAEAAIPFIKEAGLDPEARPRQWLEQLVNLYRERFKTLAEFPKKTAFFFSDNFEYDEAAVSKFLKNEGTIETLAAARHELAKLENFGPASLETCLREVAKQRAVGLGKVAQPLRVAVTGVSVSASLFETLMLLGRETVLRRLERVVKS
jgi:glutamyl-tRNA synthetase